MKRLLIATTNPGKLAEISSFLSDLPLRLVSLKDVEITTDVEETGKTYEENSKMKALFYAKKSGLPSLADDGGLEIAAINNEPGVKSRRWLGQDTTYDDLIAHMRKVALELPEDNRRASFKVVLTLALPNGKMWSVQDQVDGIIAKEPNMKFLKGYPYRSFFYLPEVKKYYHESELTPEQMREYNHRYKAIEKLKPIIKKELC